ncbi:MAG TPA: GNAT family protein [Actinophytocola sp.]|uniref:GNAT family N-acetyltransferase n=1 Tax=Actinophytocola sp. TaxID=1872138 RepID=UPI002DDD569A|nr:GNAT family protein [Actinophytocola sp.]HEV2778964.1 GNAT family protein [Actinophytocola sp.]
MLEHLFTNQGLHRVSAECDARSARLLHRPGFRQEGHRRAHTWIKNEWTATSASDSSPMTGRTIP